MSETISKSAVCEIIADIYPTDGEKVVDVKQIDKAYEAIQQLPPTQPEIIRCKDCKHYKFSDNRAFGFPVKRCEWTGFEDVDDDDYCSRAEAKEDVDD